MDLAVVVDLFDTHDQPEPLGASQKNAGRRVEIVRKAVRSSPRGGDLAIVSLEGQRPRHHVHDPPTSPEPFDRWFRNHVRHVHGAVLEEGLVISELALDFDFDINRI